MIKIRIVLITNTEIKFELTSSYHYHIGANYVMVENEDEGETHYIPLYQVKEIIVNEK